jgi:hypothetical protein
MRADIAIRNTASGTTAMLSRSRRSFGVSTACICKGHIRNQDLPRGAASICSAATAANSLTFLRARSTALGSTQVDVLWLWLWKYSFCSGRAQQLVSCKVHPPAAKQVVWRQHMAASQAAETLLECPPQMLGPGTRPMTRRQSERPGLSLPAPQADPLLL